MYPSSLLGVPCFPIFKSEDVDSAADYQDILVQILLDCMDEKVEDDRDLLSQVQRGIF